jgi:hypothetical protein
MRFEFLTTFRTEPLLELSMIPHFHTLELTRMKKGTDISDILYLTTIKNPVKQETKVPKVLRQTRDFIYNIDLFC